VSNTVTIIEKAPQEMHGDVKIVDNVFVKMIPLNGIGHKVQGHAHAFDHITLLSNGSVRMKHANGESVFTAPALIVTKKGTMHEFTSLEDFSLLCCIHAIRDGDDVDDIADANIDEEKARELTAVFSLLMMEKA